MDDRRPPRPPEDPLSEGAPDPEDEEAGRDWVGGVRFRQRTSELLTGLLDRDGAFRRGQEMVTGVTQATKEELMRIVSAEVRSFLDKMDAVDLLQQVVSGLTVDVNMQVRFSRDQGEGLRSEVTRSDAEVGTKPPAPPPETPNPPPSAAGAGAGARSPSDNPPSTPTAPPPRARRRPRPSVEEIDEALDHVLDED